MKSWSRYWVYWIHISQYGNTANIIQMGKKFVKRNFWFVTVQECRGAGNTGVGTERQDHLGGLQERELFFRAHGFKEKLAHSASSDAVKVSSWFIGKYDCWIHNKGSSYSYTLFFSARKPFCFGIYMIFKTNTRNQITS